MKESQFTDFEHRRAHRFVISIWGSYGRSGGSLNVDRWRWIPAFQLSLCGRRELKCISCATLTAVLLSLHFTSLHLNFCPAGAKLIHYCTITLILSIQFNSNSASYIPVWIISWDFYTTSLSHFGPPGL